MDYSKIILDGTLETLTMVGLSTLFSIIIGLPIGVLVSLTAKGGLCQNKIVSFFCDVIINLGRSIPFIIMLVLLIPLTRLIVGTSIGTIAMVVPLTISAIPFFARLVDSSIKELPNGVIEAGLSMGASKLQIVFTVLIGESLPSIIRAVCITAITLVGYSAMAGTVAGGGLGQLAFSYGYVRYDYVMMVATVVILVLIVQVLQISFSLLAYFIDKRKR